MLSEFVQDVLRPLWGVWMMLLFLGIVFWAFRPKNKDRFAAYSDIPLRDEEIKER